MDRYDICMIYMLNTNNRNSIGLSVLSVKPVVNFNVQASRYHLSYVVTGVCIFCIART